MKKTFLLFPACCIVLMLLFSCNTGSYELGGFLETDTAGHFLETVTYTYYWDVEIGTEYFSVKNEETFASNGDWKVTRLVYEGVGEDIDLDTITNEGYLPWEEFTGTYKYNPLLLECTKERNTYKKNSEWIYDEVLGEDIRVYSAEGRSGSYNDIETNTWFFTEHNFGSAFRMNLGKWRYTYRWQSSDGSSTYRYDHDISFVLNTLVHRYTDHNSDVEMPLNGNLSWERERRIKLTEDIPDWNLFVGGTTRRVIGYVSSDRQRDFWDGDYLEEWTDDPWDEVGEAYSTSFTHFGDFITYTGNVSGYERGGLLK